MLAVTAAVFGFGKAKRFIRCFSALFGVSFVLAGATMAVWLLFEPSSLLVRNGAVYFDIGFLSLVLSAAALYAAVWLGKRYLARKSSEKAECAVRIALGSSFVNVKGILDTGNTLTDSFTGKKVSVIDKSTALCLLPFDAEECISRWDFEKLPKYMHLTVSNTVGGEGLLPVFTADSMAVVLNEKEYTVKNAAVAVSGSETFGSFGMLINSELIGEDELDKKTYSTHKAVPFKTEKQSGLLHKRSADLAGTAQRRGRKADNAAHRARR